MTTSTYSVERLKAFDCSQWFFRDKPRRVSISKSLILLQSPRKSATKIWLYFNRIVNQIKSQLIGKRVKG